jgi:hypothetical protein
MSPWLNHCFQLKPLSQNGVKAHENQTDRRTANWSPTPITCYSAAFSSIVELQIPFQLIFRSGFSIETRAADRTNFSFSRLFLIIPDFDSPIN